MFNLFARKRLPFEQTRYLVMDLEMTGLDAQEHAIVSAGTVMISNGRIQLASAEHRYFLPTSIMAEDVAETAHIHMITDEKREREGEPTAALVARFGRASAGRCLGVSLCTDRYAVPDRKCPALWHNAAQSKNIRYCFV